jgi:cobalt-zinc-cadmium efflux system protein
MHIHHPTSRRGAHGHEHHDHAHHHEHDGAHHQDHKFTLKIAEQNRLIISIIVTGIVMVVEIVGGVLSNSIALLSDGAHMFTHVFALAISLAAILIAAQKPTYLRTFGLYRAEVLASLLNSVLLFIVTVGIVWESIRRLQSPESIKTGEMFFIAVIGLAVNLATIFLLRGVSRDDRNIRSAFLHMIADALSSVGVVGGALAIRFTGWAFIDPLLGIAISALIAVWAWNLFADSVRVLLEIAPRDMAIDRIKEQIMRHDARVVDVSDMHVTEITTGLYNFTAHVEVRGDSLGEASAVIEAINDVLCDHYNIHHTTIQVYRAADAIKKEGNLR